MIVVDAVILGVRVPDCVCVGVLEGVLEEVMEREDVIEAVREGVPV